MRELPTLTPRRVAARAREAGFQLPEENGDLNTAPGGRQAPDRRGGPAVTSTSVECRDEIAAFFTAHVTRRRRAHTPPEARDRGRVPDRSAILLRRPTSPST